LFTALTALCLVAPAPTQPPTSAPDHKQAVVDLLEAARAASKFPGACAAWVDEAGRGETVAVGDLTTRDRLMSGSIGKTYVAALVLRLVDAGKLALDDAARTHLGEAAWLDRVPNGETVTVRQLLQHQSGIPEHVWQPAFEAALLAEPDRVWTPPDLLAFVAGQEPLFLPGKGWSYADTNYVLLGAVVEAVAGRGCFELIERELLEPLALADTVVNRSRKVPQLACGHTGGLLGFPRGPVLRDGEYPVNPQFEYCGGGMSSTTLDLARWCQALYGGDVVAPRLRREMREGVPAKTGRNHRYGLGTMVIETAHGRAFGHTGVMPGYLSVMLYYEDLRLAVAVQFDTDEARRLGKRLESYADAVAAVVHGD